MSEFLRLIAFYYACDAAAIDGLLTRSERLECIRHYTAIKAHFAGPLRNPQDHVEGFRAFKTWEDENPALVAQLRTPRR